ncbi:MAG TPA: replicative DNA helicase [Bacteroidales bacterium]|nr:replicative DNA helicase [Bacteroidales bacterium]HPM86451.1 replicative DNA helicase [Bacteroidales bacterium]HQM68170.1 replicative DNA helicase [Bacteroidales bacterium]
MAKQIKTSKPMVTVLPDFGKVPPQAIDMEEAVLGAIMLEKEAVITILDILKPESFYKDSHRKIFKAVSDLSTREFPVDLYTVTEELRAHGELESVGGPVYLSQLTSKVVSAANVDYHARIVAQKYIQRELIRVSTEIQTRAFDDTWDVTELLDYSENELFQIAEGNIKREVSPINMVIKEAIKEIEEAGKREDALVGIPSGFTKLDRLTSGWQKAELVIIAARPSMGKTAFALSMARNMAIDHDKKVAIFSCEMSSIQLVNRLIVAETDIAGDKIRNGRLSEEEWKQLDTRIKKLVQAPIFIDDTPAISIFELRAKCRRLMAQHKLDIVIVDYLQLMSGPDNAGSREQEVSNISRSLKSIAKELNVPIIALSQLNRSVEMRGGTKRPLLSDLRESGAIEQDADMVVFIHRQEKFGMLTFDDGSSTKGIAEIILAKNRNGPVDDVRLRFREEKAQFVDMDEFDIENMPEMNGTQSITLGSKMNHDRLRDTGSDFDREHDFHDEPPFA